MSCCIFLPLNKYNHVVLHTQVPFAKSFALSHAMRLDPPVEFEQILSCVSAWTKLRQMFSALRFTSSWAPCNDTAHSHPKNFSA